jgi:lipopolysaccharide cholinephosphotransferase
MNSNTVQIQEKLSRMFKEVTQILDNNNLKYYAVGGTLLGAVRHKGFIPWDDDIDISLPRPEYELFLKNASQILPQHYVLETFSDTGVFPHLFAKIYDKRTTLVENFTQPLTRGIYIDVFPLDGISEDEQIQKSNVKLMRNYLKIYRRCHTTKPKSNTIAKRFAHHLLFPIIKTIFPKDKLLKKIKTLYSLQPWENAKFTVNYFGAWRLKEVQPKSWYQERIKYKFNDFEIWGPKEYDKVLTRLYGDYMTPPPKEKQISHHRVRFVDLNLPYKDCKEDFTFKPKSFF